MNIECIGVSTFHRPILPDNQDFNSPKHVQNTHRTEENIRKSYFLLINKSNNNDNSDNNNNNNNINNASPVIHVTQELLLQVVNKT